MLSTSNLVQSLSNEAFCPNLGKLLVNFDKEILSLMREAKWLQRLDIAIPETARMVLLQEEKFKHYFNQLTYSLKVPARILNVFFLTYQHSPRMVVIEGHLAKFLKAVLVF